MIIADFIKLLENRIPPSWCFEWDHCGWHFGNPRTNLSKLALSLNMTAETIGQAVRFGAQMLISHHPLTMESIEGIYINSHPGDLLDLAWRGKLCLYSAHTNWDVAPEGVNCSLAESLGLSSVSSLVDIGCNPEMDANLLNGVYGDLNAPEWVSSLAEKLIGLWGLDWVRVHGDDSMLVTRVGICGGSGGSMWRRALEKKCEAFISADFKYHDRLDALRSKFSLIEVDHGGMERVSLNKLKNLLDGIAPDVNIAIIEENVSPLFREMRP